MPITNLRQGTGVRIAAKFQSAQGVPVVYTDLVNDDILRAEDVDINPNVQIISQTGLTGSVFEQDEGVALVGIQPTVDLVVKASPASVKLFTKSLLGVVGVADGVGPTGGPVTKIEGFALGIPFFLSVFYDTAFEAFRVLDVFFHTLEFNSKSAENLIMNTSGVGADFAVLGPQLTTQVLTNFDTYSHKLSVLDDLVGGTPIELFTSEQTLRLEQGRIVTQGNSVQPNLVAKDGRLLVTGTLTTRLSDETAPFFDRLLAVTRSNITMRYFQQDGKLLELIIRNATVEVQPNRVNPDGTIADLAINFTARQSGIDTFPFTIRVEE